jgi:hypothetical protein
VVWFVTYMSHTLIRKEMERQGLQGEVMGVLESGQNAGVNPPLKPHPSWDNAVKNTYLCAE